MNISKFNQPSNQINFALFNSSRFFSLFISSFTSFSIAFLIYLLVTAGCRLSSLPTHSSLLPSSASSHRDPSIYST